MLKARSRRTFSSSVSGNADAGASRRWAAGGPIHALLSNKGGRGRSKSPRLEQPASRMRLPAIARSASILFNARGRAVDRIVIIPADFSFHDRDARRRRPRPGLRPEPGATPSLGLSTPRSMRTTGKMMMVAPSHWELDRGPRREMRRSRGNLTTVSISIDPAVPPAPAVGPSAPRYASQLRDDIVNDGLRRDAASGNIAGRFW